MIVSQQGAAHGTHPGRGGLWGEPGPREGLFLGVALALVAALPFLVSVYPQMVDYPAHLARYYIMLDGGKNPFLDRYYGFEWRWSGNLGADLLIWPLAKLFGLERAGWLIGLILPPLTGFGLMAVEWVLRRRVGVGAILAFATIWSPAMGMGFYNFCLGLALALFAFALWVRMQGVRWRWAVFLPLAVVVWLCHLAGWGVLGLLVFGYEWHRKKGLTAFLAPWPLMLPFLPILLEGEANGVLAYGTNLLHYKLFILFQSLRVQSFAFDLGTLVVIVLIVLKAAASGKIDGRLGWAALLLAIGVIAVPRHLGGGDYADYRLTAVALMIGCLAIDWRAPRWVLWIAPALFVARLVPIVVAWQQDSRELVQDLRALDYLPEGAKVAGAVINDDVWALNSFSHAPCYATLRRNALVNSHFAVPGVHMLHVKEGGPGFVDASQRIMHRRGTPIDLSNFKPAKQADYLWYFGNEEPSKLPSGAQVMFRTPTSFLARLANRESPR